MFNSSVAFKIGGFLFRFYYFFYLALLPWYESISDMFRWPTSATLSNYLFWRNFNGILLKIQRLLYTRHPGVTWISIVSFNILTYILLELNLIFVACLPLNIFTLFPYIGSEVCDDKKIIELANDYAQNKNTPRLTDENMYQITTAFEVLQRLDDGVRRELTVLCNDKNLPILQNLLNSSSELYIHNLLDWIKFLSYGSAAIYHKVNGRMVPDLIIFSYNGEWSEYTPKTAKWVGARGVFSNMLKTHSSLLLHQFASNIYVSSIFYHTKTQLSFYHPVHVLLDPFMHNLYVSTAIFLETGLGPIKTNNIINKIATNFHYFEILNTSIIDFLHYLHKKYGWSIMEYDLILKRNEIDDVKFEQKESLMEIYKILKEMIHEVIDHYYKSVEYIRRDSELMAWYTAISIEMGERFPKELTVESLKSIILNTAFCSSVRHSQSHTNSSVLYHPLDFNRRMSRVDLFIKGEEIISTCGDVYKDLAIASIPTVPYNIFGRGVGNRYRGPVQDIMNRFTKKVEEYKKREIHSVWTEYIYLLERSNTY